jgi:hypothetical protein
MRVRRFNGRTTSRVRFLGVLGAFGLWAALLLTTASSVLAVGTATPSLQTKPSPGVSLGGSISDSAQMIGIPGGGGSVGTPPTGTLTFKLYGPNDATCSPAHLVYTTTAPLMVTGGVVSIASTGTYTPPAGAAGTYRWVASYPGDATYKALTSGCGDETVQVTDVTPTLTTVASPGVQAGNGTLTDTATLTGGMAATGSITFLLFPPSDPTCAGKVVAAKSTVPVTNPASTTSDPFNPTTPGTYHWIAIYSGDIHNGAVQGACTDPNEAVVVTPGPVKPGTTPGGSSPPPGTVPGAKGPCDPVATAKAVLAGISATLIGQPAGFANNCSAGLRIVLRAKEIRPGNRGTPRHDGFTTMANVLTHIAPSGPALSFTLNAAGEALRQYSLSHNRPLTAFLIVHVRPDKTSSATESLQILTLG